MPVAGNGDFNGDGFSDVAVAAPFEQEKGRVMVFSGGPAGLNSQPDWTFSGQKAGPSLGLWLVMGGDVNGDGISDLVVSEWQGEFGPTNEVCAIHLFCGSTNGLPAASTQTLPSDVGPFHLRIELAAAGDVNGDGYGDLAVLATDRNQPVDGRLALMIFHGSSEGFRLEPACVAHSEQAGSLFGHDLASAGDVNGDGYDDFLIGAMKFTGRYPNGGKAYLFLGSLTGLKPKPAWTMEYPLPVIPGWHDNLFFSCGLGCAGDVNGDGFDDVLIGAWFANHGEIAEGAAFVFHGSAQGPADQPDWYVEGDHPHVLLGQSVSTASDLNGDGFDDVIIGVPSAEHGQADEGVALVFYGSKSGLRKQLAWTFDGDRNHGHLGELVSNAGDLNGDGVPDLLLIGRDMEQPSDPRLRIIAVYGTPGGLKGSSNWRLNKPLLALVQQRLDRISRESIWLGVIVMAVTGMVALLLIQTKLKRRIAALVEQNRELALVQERARLARDIHDHLGADLTDLAVQLEQTRQQADFSEVGRRLAGLSSFTTRLLDTVRELVWATTPECDTLDNLVSFLGEQIAGFLHGNGLGCELDFPADLPARGISSSLRHNMVLMVKEALHNVVKHAGSTRVEVRLREENGRLSLRICDNGCGFSASLITDCGGTWRGPNHHGGSGLRNLRTRATKLGGSCEIRSAPGQGTTVEFSLPLEAEDQLNDP
ncbi:MAG: FG-GAP-like repeat-containing protein [Verrucomicrobiales bacterium]|nr:FG-GAP-like repeat-containing protein [Verrucomicrobiales bacterium]